MFFFRNTAKFTSTEDSEVRKFLKGSANFNGLMSLYKIHKGKNLNKLDDMIKEIQEAKSFWGVKLALDRFDPDDVEGAANFLEFVIIPKVIYGGVYVASYFHDGAKVAYYARNLFCEARDIGEEYNKHSARLG